MEFMKKIAKLDEDDRFLPIPPSVQEGLEEESKIDDFEILKEVGKGTFGKVSKVSHKVTGGIYAMKIIDKRERQNIRGRPHFRREVEIMYKVRHPNIVKLYSHFEDEDCCYFIMELVNGGNLYDKIKKEKTISQANIVRYMTELISVMYYLHTLNPPIIHRDIKPENVLIDDKGSIKLTDFGWSNYVEEESNAVRTTYCGTPLYLAPEMIKTVGHNEFLDIWCVGVLMFEMITGTLPFSGQNFETVTGNILKNNIVWPSNIDKDAKDLLSKILKTKPDERYSLKEILLHPYFTKINNQSGLSLESSSFQSSEFDNSIFLVSKNLPENKKHLKKSPTKVISDDISSDGGSVEIFKLKQDKYKLKKDYNAMKQKAKNFEKDLFILQDLFMKEKLKVTQMEKENYQFKLKINELETQLREVNKTLDEKQSILMDAYNQINELEDKLSANLKNTKALMVSYKPNEDTSKLEESYKSKIEELQQTIEEMSKNKEMKLPVNYARRSENLELFYSINTYNDEHNMKSIMSNDIPFETQLTAKVKSNDLKLERDLEELRVEIQTLKRDIEAKEIEIKKLQEEKVTIKESVTKFYESTFKKYEDAFKFKENEIEKLNNKLLKYSKYENKKKTKEES